MRLQNNFRLNGVAFAPDGGGGGGGGGEPDAAAAAEAAAAKSTEFLATLPEDLRADERFKGVSDVGALAKRFAGAVELPAADAKPEEAAKALDALALKLGMPEKADDYKIAELADGMKYTDQGLALQAEFKPIARELRLTQTQVDGIVAFNNKLALAGLTAEATGLATTEAELRKTHGDKFDAKLELANRAVQAVLEKSGLQLDTFKQLKLADGSFLGDSKLANILFIGIGEALADTKFVGGGGGNPDGGQKSLAETLYPPEKKE